MIAMLGRSAPPDPALARQMLAAAPHRGSCVTLRVLGNCVLGVANRPDFVGATISSEGPVIAVLSGRLDNATELHRMLTAGDSPPASDRKSTRLNSSHSQISYAVFCLKKKKK